MVDWDVVKQQLEQAIGAELAWVRLPLPEWEGAEADAGPGRSSRIRDGRVVFFASVEGEAVKGLTIPETALTAAERRLIDLMLEAVRLPAPEGGLTSKEEEVKNKVLREWLLEHLERGVFNRELPDSFSAYTALYTEKIPILLQTEESGNRPKRTEELKRLLSTFFESDILLLSLTEREWVVLGPESLVRDSGSDMDAEETVEEALESIASGLYEMLTAEWTGDCHVAIAYPIVPARSLLASVKLLRDCLYLGRRYHVGEELHFPWKLLLDKLLDAVPEDSMQEFVKAVLKRMDQFLDAEMEHTLNEFFNLDCNVSETAKQLYIHRNTLLYRLDKFKQETGFDVRHFSQAVLVKLALQLYKVTKRK